MREGLPVNFPWIDILEKTPHRCLNLALSSVEAYLRGTASAHSNFEFFWFTFCGKRL